MNRYQLGAENVTGVDSTSDNVLCVPVTSDSGQVGAGIESFANYDGIPAGAKDRPGLEGLFWSHDGTIVHKWHHYLPIYERYFSSFRGRKPRFLEIGVSKGGSLSLWRKYFGPDAIIFGIDIDPACDAFNGLSGQVRIGSQDDPEFLVNVVKEMGGVDIVLDDGSHYSKHIRASINTLFPLLEEGGVYMVEDLHATYWDSHEGGYQQSTSFIGDIRQMYDDMHHWYHNEGQRIKATTDTLASLHLYDSIAVLEKGRVLRPRHSQIGTAE
ncbi:Methyltransferase domain-containing protein [Pseudorhodobacter antarcticus]|uniref:Methyltransferase domain-containing protein n=2 Tax=Pseudorhodobacter antarcticus TaxID=1077947 RepID=A0A1H8NN13_9RHOB|nr:Methyltransferase domain-containing protein [Pseudorhodobacter antarcticus]